MSNIITSKAMPDTLRRAINWLTMEREFWASLLLEMRLKEVTTPPNRIIGPKQSNALPFTMGTDGTRIYWHRDFIDSINVPICAFALAHEVAHPMLLHFQRIYQHGISGPNWTPKSDSQGRLISRDPLLWNIAGDLIINDMLKASGFTVWDKALLDPKYSMSKGWTTEKVYDDLVQKSKSKEKGCDPSESGSKEKGCFPFDLSESGTGSDLCEPQADANLDAEAEEWQERVVRAATLARQRGTMPAGLDCLIKEYTEPVYPVWLLLERYIDSVLKEDDTSWRRPHQNLMNVGILLPGPYSEQVSRVELWYDTSGSVPDEDLSRFHRIGGDIIRNAKPGVLAIGQCDAEVTSHTEVRTSSDWPSDIKITGRGGTSFQPPFAHLAERNIRPSVLIYLTDLMGDFPSEPPPYPVLWISTTSEVAPFGTTIHLKE